MNLVQFQGRIFAHGQEAHRLHDDAQRLRVALWDLISEWNRAVPEDLRLNPETVLYGPSEVEAPRAVSQDQPALPGL